MGRGLGFEAGVGVISYPGPPEVDHVGYRAELLASQLAFDGFAGQAGPAGAGLPIAQDNLLAAAEGDKLQRPPVQVPERGAVLMRMMVINYDTRERHILRLVADLKRLGSDPALHHTA